MYLPTGRSDRCGQNIGHLMLSLELGDYFA